MYRVLKRLECTGMLKRLLKEGVIPCAIENHKYIYERYLKECDKVKSNRQAISNVSEDFNVSERLVYKVIKTMKG